MCSKRIKILIWAFLLWSLPQGLQAQTTDRLYYFWSFSMPEESVKAAFADGEKVGMIAVLRGLPSGPAGRSLARIKSLIANRKITVLIDPILYQRYQVASAPTFVLATGVNEACENCEPTPRHWSVVGDVTLRAALQILGRNTPVAEGFLEKLNQGFFSK